MSDPLLPPKAFSTIRAGKIAVIPNFLPSSDVADLRKDAMGLYADDRFSTDALASYGSTGSFDPSKDRAVLKLKQWKDKGLGSYETRQRFAARMSDLRSQLSLSLERPNLNQGVATTGYGEGSTEISYTRFGPGAFLKRHVDEHHEELKGKDGWSKPTRRSISWLIYLNDKWDSGKYGGELKCYERVVPPATEVGAQPNGDLQIGWLRASPQDPLERPVFLDSRRHFSGKDGNCAMYINDPNGSGVQYITGDFYAHPILFMSGGELLTKKLLLNRRDFAQRFHFIEPPKSLIGDLMASTKLATDESALEVEPNGGTLVLFDSVSLPHEVLATRGRERWATSGWFHEDQQHERP
jgi:Rps23 Pro-64 3,4-dihydroxylase Tpa1-like proline 4-hydroxylase